MWRAQLYRSRHRARVGEDLAVRFSALEPLPAASGDAVRWGAAEAGDRWGDHVAARILLLDEPSLGTSALSMGTIFEMIGG